MRLIDADALKIEIACLHGSDHHTIRYLNNAPTVDAVPVVRCKDCTWCFAPKNKGWVDDVLLCSEGLETRLVGENDYCSKGEKKEE